MATSQEHDQIINQLTDDNQLLVQRLEDEEAHSKELEGLLEQSDFDRKEVEAALAKLQDEFAAERESSVQIIERQATAIRALNEARKNSTIATGQEDTPDPVLMADIRRLQAIEKELQTTLAGCRRDLKARSDEVDSLRSELTESSTERLKLEQLVASKDAQLTRSLADLEEARTAWETEQASNASLRDDMERLRASHSTDLANANDRMQRLATQLESASAHGRTQSNEQWAETIADLRAQNAAAREELSEVKQQLHERTLECSTLRQALDGSRKERNTLAHSVSELSSELEELRGDKTTAEMRLGSDRELLARSQERVRQLAAELQTISAEFGELRAEHASVQSKAEHSANQAATVQTQYREALQTANDLELRVAELETTLKLREDELQILESKYQRKLDLHKTESGHELRRASLRHDESVDAAVAAAVAAATEKLEAQLRTERARHQAELERVEAHKAALVNETKARAAKVLRELTAKHLASFDESKRQTTLQAQEQATRHEVELLAAAQSREKVLREAEAAYRQQLDEVQEELTGQVKLYRQVASVEKLCSWWLNRRRALQSAALFTLRRHAAQAKALEDGKVYWALFALRQHRRRRLLKAMIDEWRATVTFSRLGLLSKVLVGHPAGTSADEGVAPLEWRSVGPTLGDERVPTGTLVMRNGAVFTRLEAIRAGILPGDDHSQTEYTDNLSEAQSVSMRSKSVSTFHQLGNHPARRMMEEESEANPQKDLKPESLRGSSRMLRMGTAMQRWTAAATQSVLTEHGFRVASPLVAIVYGCLSAGRWQYLHQVTGRIKGNIVANDANRKSTARPLAVPSQLLPGVHAGTGEGSLISELSPVGAASRGLRGAADTTTDLQGGAFSFRSGAGRIGSQPASSIPRNPSGAGSYNPHRRAGLPSPRSARGGGLKHDPEYERRGSAHSLPSRGSDFDMDASLYQDSEQPRFWAQESQDGYGRAGPWSALLPVSVASRPPTAPSGRNQGSSHVAGALWPRMGSNVKVMFLQADKLAALLRLAGLMHRLRLNRLREAKEQWARVAGVVASAPPVPTDPEELSQLREALDIAFDTIQQQETRLTQQSDDLVRLKRSNGELQRQVFELELT